MREGLPIALVLLGLGTGCGRLGYAPLSDVADGGAAGTAPVAGRGGSAGGGTAGGAPAAAGGSSGGAAGGAPAGAGGSSGGVGGGSGGAIAGAGGSTGLGGAGLAGVPCPSATYGGHLYAVCEGPVSWWVAADDCAVKSMRLARIDDANENAWVRATAFAGITDTMSASWVWLGGTDQAVVGDWRWTDGELFWLGSSNGSAQGGLYENWAAGSPTNGGGATDCAIMQTLGFWTDWECARLQRYVCEQY